MRPATHSVHEVALRDVVALVEPGFASGEKSADGVAQVRMNNVTTEGQFDWSAVRRVPATSQQIRRYQLRDGDVLFNSTNSPELVGKSALFRETGEPTVFSNHFLRVRPKVDLLDGGYLVRWLNVLWNRRHFETRCAQWVNQATFRKDDLLSIRVPLPPLTEQRRIAAILDKADAIRHKRQQAIQLLDELLGSAFLDMFGDPVTNPKGWPIVTIGEVAADRGLIVDGPFGSSLKPECYVGTGVRVIRNVNIKPGRFDTSEFKFVTAEKFEDLRRSEVVPGDVLISTKGTVGNVCLMPNLPGPSLLSATGTVRVRLPNEDPLRGAFLVAQMNTNHYRTYIASLQAGSNQQYLNLSAIRSMRVIAPSLAVQDRYLEIERRLDHVRGDHKRATAAKDDMFASLAQRAFRGELRAGATSR